MVLEGIDIGSIRSGSKSHFLHSRRIDMAGILDGKVALITGAGSGIGRATSKIFAREGAMLVLVDVVADAAQQTLEAAKAAGAEAICLKADVANSNEVEAAVARTVAQFGRLDCAFN